VRRLALYTTVNYDDIGAVRHKDPDSETIIEQKYIIFKTS
jgi:hypothetical protein